jgi:hypothetical protein
LGLANDELGYILPDEEYVWPIRSIGNHYEETMSAGPAAGTLFAFHTHCSKLTLPL